MTYVSKHKTLDVMFVQLHASLMKTYDIWGFIGFLVCWSWGCFYDHSSVYT